MRPFILLALLVLSGCAAPRASTSEINDVAASTIGCLKAAAKTHDDQKSDAATVGYGLTGLCSSEINAAIETASRGANYENRQMARQRLTAYYEKTATTIVLQERSEKKGK